MLQDAAQSRLFFICGACFVNRTRVVNLACWRLRPWIQNFRRPLPSLGLGGAAPRTTVSCGPTCASFASGQLWLPRLLSIVYGVSQLSAPCETFATWLFSWAFRNCRSACFACAWQHSLQLQPLAPWLQLEPHNLGFRNCRSARFAWLENPHSCNLSALAKVAKLLQLALRQGCDTIAAGAPHLAWKKFFLRHAENYKCFCSARAKNTVNTVIFATKCKHIVNTVVLGFRGAENIGIYGVFCSESVKKMRKHHLCDDF